jgi:MGT family glycosyltransferase
MTTPPTAAVVHFPSGGHILPLLPLVDALGRQGLRTVQWAPQEWEERCLAAGGEFRALPDLSDLAWPEPTLPRIAAFLGRLAERLAPWMGEQLADAGADVVVRDSFAQYGRYAALASEVPEFVLPPMMAFHRGVRPGIRDILPFAASLIRGAPAIRELRRTSRRLAGSYGEELGGPLAVFSGRHGAPMFVATVPALQMRPQSLRGEDVSFIGPLRALAPSHGEEPALDGLDEQALLIYVSLGTVFEQQVGFFRLAAHALAGPGRRVILSIGRLDPATLGPLPDGVSAHAHVDQLAVLRRAQLFLSHCGFNSMQEGLAAGVPMLLYPQMFEQAINADAVVRQGAGLRLRRPSAESISRAASELLADASYREAAGRLASELRSAPGAAEAIERVLAAAREHAARATSGVPQGGGVHLTHSE